LRQRKYIEERLPEEYEKCLVGLNSILKEVWTTSQQAVDKREKIQALSLAKECYSMKLDPLTNATVVEDAIRFVSSNNKAKETLKSASKGRSEDDNESKELDYDEDEGLLEEEQEEKTGETAVTTDQVF
jgi:hypothetical protein